MASPNSIFISIVSDGDAPLGMTLRSAWERAQTPSALHFGVVNCSSALAPLPDKPVPPEHIAVVGVARGSMGLAAARAVAMGLYARQQWILQVQAGVEFDQHWDALLIEQAARLGGAQGDWVISCPNEPYRGKTLDQRFLFAPGRFADFFPADPLLEESEADQGLAARIFTHGWKLVCLSLVPVRAFGAWWPRHAAPDAQRAEQSKERLARLLSGDAALGAFGLGPQRSVADFKPGSLPLPQPSRGLDDSWKKWLAENLQRGCSPEELLAILLKHEFSLASVRECMGVCFPQSATPLGDSSASGQPEPDYPGIARPPLMRRGHPKLRAIDTKKLQLYTLDDCLGEDECSALIEVINRRLRPSTVTLTGTDKHFRTSRTCDLSELQDPLVAMIDEKIARTLGIRRAYAEANQAQRYDVGQQFKAHTDYFEPGTEEFATFGGDAGNRTWTVMIYLNDGMQGGGTHFFALDRTFEPKRGQALLWNNLYPDGAPNPDTLHAGMPVTQGHKIIITLWFRARGKGPMFFEE
jgi:prolyl 4-hydroxylase